MVCCEHGAAPSAVPEPWGCSCRPFLRRGAAALARARPGSCSTLPAAALHIRCVKPGWAKEPPGISLSPRQEGLQGHGGLRGLKWAPVSSDTRRTRLEFEVCAPLLPAPRAIPTLASCSGQGTDSICPFSLCRLTDPALTEVFSDHRDLIAKHFLAMTAVPALVCWVYPRPGAAWRGTGRDSHSPDRRTIPAAVPLPAAALGGSAEAGSALPPSCLAQAALAVPAAGRVLGGREVPGPPTPL